MPSDASLTNGSHQEGHSPPGADTRGGALHAPLDGPWECKIAFPLHGPSNDPAPTDRSLREARSPAASTGTQGAALPTEPLKQPCEHMLALSPPGPTSDPSSTEPSFLKQVTSGTSSTVLPTEPREQPEKRLEQPSRGPPSDPAPTEGSPPKDGSTAAATGTDSRASPTEPPRGCKLALPPRGPPSVPVPTHGSAGEAESPAAATGIPNTVLPAESLAPPCGRQLALCPRGSKSLVLSGALNLEMPCTRAGEMQTTFVLNWPSRRSGPVKTCPSSLTNEGSPVGTAPLFPALTGPSRSYARLAAYAGSETRKPGEDEADFCLRHLTFLSCVVDRMPYGIDMDIYPDGPVISSITAGSHAEQAGIRAGDVLVEVNGQPVGPVAELQAALHAPCPYTITVVRGRSGGQPPQPAPDRGIRDEAAQTPCDEPTARPLEQHRRRGRAGKAKVSGKRRGEPGKSLSQDWSPC